MSEYYTILLKAMKVKKCRDCKFYKENSDRVCNFIVCPLVSMSPVDKLKTEKYSEYMIRWLLQDDKGSE